MIMNITKLRKSWPVILFLLAYSIMVWQMFGERVEVGEESAGLNPLFLLWIFAFPVLGCGILYLLFFKVPERRQKTVPLYFALAGIFAVTLLTFSGRWILALAAMLAIVLGGWLAPARASEEDHS
jgi:hypothetical protein